jgi:hypothetical protein
VVVVVAVLIAAAALAARICWGGRCSARARAILRFINGITLSRRRLKYPSSSSAEERAVRWLIEDDLFTAVADKQSLRQRYVLAILDFAGANFGTPCTNGGECEWSGVECDGKGRVTALKLVYQSVQGQIPADLGLLTDLTFLSLAINSLSGTIPSSLGALTALKYLALDKNDLSGTIPSSLGALTTLTSFYIYDTQLVGTVPFCNSDQFLEDVEADCAKVRCTCCTKCCSSNSC